MIKGKGNPNSEEFSKKIGVLYSLAYAIRMMPKQGLTTVTHLNINKYI